MLVLAKPEVKIDLGSVNQDLIDCEQNISAAKKKHNDYLKALGLPALPW